MKSKTYKMNYEQLSKNQRLLTEGMTNLGFKPIQLQNQDISTNTTFISPDDEFYDFNIFFDELKQYGFTIYPGRINNSECFKIANTEKLDKNDIDNLLDSMMKSMYWEWIAI